MVHAAAGLVAQLGGGNHQVDAHAQQDQEQTSPGDQTLGAQLEAVTGAGPLVRGVDRGVAIHVGTILVLEPVHTVALALAALRVNPALLLHEAGPAL
eukprot:CAMPEP_0202893074 /NCGR_PEP_ID=MMETSP1392-20130828/2712_1 /ASSEMBLY_ACC=CAM_ASM_000868 /TAXON_ID=225041 /ORGANISM="Chlamydomonas chlamydogama, Strain SAG 11-48b" /LENGTH=96 /DNA_ID=CAMNT_0049577267 /DNA_START=583 /DNA_END=873 /DNA_ORIENTATION=-